MNARTGTLRMPSKRSYRQIKNSRVPRNKIGNIFKPIRISLREIAAASIAMALLVLGVWSGYQIHSVANDIDLLQKEAATLTAQSKSLKERESVLKDPKHLKRLGRKLGLHPARKDQLIKLN